GVAPLAQCRLAHAVPRVWYRLPAGLILFAGHDAALRRKLVDLAAYRFPRDRFVRERHLEHHAARLHIGHPPLGRTLTRTHPGFGGLLGEGLVREDVDPHLPTPLDVAGHGDTRGLDLPVGHVSRLERLDPEVTERDSVTALAATRALRVVRLAETLRGLTRHQHWSALLRTLS